MMKLIKRINNWTEIIIDYISVGFFIILLLLLAINVFFRLVPIYNMSWFDEVVEFSFAWLVFFGAASLWYKKEHTRVDFIPERLKEKISGDVLNLINEVLSMMFAILFTYFSVVLFNRVTALSPILQVPRKFFYLSMPVSGILMCYYSISHIIEYVNQLRVRIQKNKA
jgi:TRAP-type transport system small permease protein